VTQTKQPPGKPGRFKLDAKLGDGAGATAATMANEATARFQYFK